MIRIDRRRHIHGDLTTTIACLAALQADLTLLAEGNAPPMSNLTEAPVLLSGAMADRKVPCLVGHLTLDNGVTQLVQTQQLWAVNWDAGWARTLDRFYRLAPQSRPSW